MAKLTRNSGSGLIARDYQSKRWPEGTVRLCDGWYESTPGRRIAVGGCGFYADKDNSQIPYLRNACLNFLQVSQYPVVLDFFAEMAYRPIKKSKTDFSVVVAFPGEDAFGFAIAYWGKCGVVYSERTDIYDDDKKEMKHFHFRNEIRKGDKVLIALGTVVDLPSLRLFADEIVRAGGKVAGVVCVVNDTFPLENEFIVSEQDAVPIFSVLSPEIPRYRQDAPEVADAVVSGSIIMDPHDSDSWSELIGSMKKRRKKD